MNGVVMWVWDIMEFVKISEAGEKMWDFKNCGKL